MKNAVKKNYNKKSGAKAVVITLLIIFVLLAGAVCTLIFGFPKTTGDICYSLGFDKWACKLYNTSYERDGDINTLYSSLNCAIKSGDNGLIISQYEKMHSNKEYAGFINFIDEQNSKVEETPLIKASLLNEDNYLKNKYVIALIDEGQAGKAFEFALNDGIKAEPTCTVLGNFLLGNFARLDKQFVLDNFFEVLQGRTQSLVDECKAYFDDVYNLFKDNYNIVSDEYIIAVGNRAVYVGETINQLNLTAGKTAESNITSLIKEVNDNIASKLMV